MLIGNGVYQGPNGEANIVDAVSSLSQQHLQLKQDTDNTENKLIEKFHDYDESLQKLVDFQEETVKFFAS
jgi:hypothetical protein